MKVTGWTNWNDGQYPDEEEVFDGDWEYAKTVVAQELREKGYKFTGDYHQYGDYGTPIIDNKWLLKCSQRAWGHIMVMAYPEDIDDSDGYGYCAWAWSAPEEMVVPNERCTVDESL